MLVELLAGISAVGQWRVKAAGHTMHGQKPDDTPVNDDCDYS
jgi:hypothetical protein